ncbi:MAG: hypothetical protein ACXAB8_04360 [Promethearchaeota archaeon]
MKGRKYFSTVLVFFILITTFVSILLINFNNYPTLNLKGENEQSLPNNPKLAGGPPLPYWAINRNATTVYRIFESLNISINTFGYNLDFATMQISFTNDSTNYYNMTSSSANEYYYEYRPLYNDPLGFQNVSFLLYNSTHLLNAHTTYTNFTTIPSYYLTTDNSEYYIGDEINAHLGVWDNKSSQFGWNITIVDSVIEASQQNIYNIGNDLVQFTYQIINETFHNKVDQTFYVKLNITNKTSGQIAAAYFPFRVTNSDPNIEVSSIRFSPTTVFRTEECEISLNVTDIEDASQYLTVSITLDDPEGDFVSNIQLTFNGDHNFSKLFSIPAGNPTGKYRVTVEAMDQDGGESSYLTFLTVKNNFPEIHSYEINGKSMDEAISIPYGNDLIFSFNVSDVENVAYIRVALIDENDQWFNVSTAYTGINTQITIRTVDLVTGVWYVYLYVTDSDGATISLISDYDFAPQAIRIIPDVLSGVLPWMIFVVGIIIGALIGVGLVFRRYKSRFVETQVTSPKEKSPVKKQQKKDSIEKIPSKEIEEITPKEEPEKGISPKRKIKRKL